MKTETLETLVISAKAICAFAGPSLLAYNVSIGQWANSDTTPTAIEWSMIVGGSVGTGLISFGSFLSSSFGKWMKSKSDIDITNGTDTKKP